MASAGVDSVVVVCASVSFCAVVASVVCSVEATVVSVVEAAVVEDAVVSSGVSPQPAKKSCFRYRYRPFWFLGAGFFFFFAAEKPKLPIRLPSEKYSP